MSNIYTETLEKVTFLYEGYSKEYRATTQPFHLEKVQNAIKDYTYDVNDLLVREPLIEHVGGLPVVATIIHSNMNDASVDLGQALVMLAVHDIGELATGDEITFNKQKDDGNKEREEALKILPEQLHAAYMEIEERSSNTGRFAKAVDKMTPDIVDLMTPAEVSIERYEKFCNKKPDEIVPMIKEFKHPYMLWSDFMKNLHLEILDRLDKKLRPFY